MKVPKNTGQEGKVLVPKIEQTQPPSFLGEQTSDQATKGLFLPTSALPQRKLRHKALIRSKTDWGKGKIPIQKLAIPWMTALISSTFPAYDKDFLLQPWIRQVI